MRLEKISESKIKEMIEDERNRLKDLWKQLHMSDQQIQDFLDSLANTGAGKLAAASLTLNPWLFAGACS
jgi:hypothetical protein